MNNEFNAVEVKDKCVEWIRDFFDKNGQGCNSVIGISGGKDSSIVTGLCVEALGRHRVIGVLMPNGEQADIEDSCRLCQYLGIRYYTINIKGAVDSILEELDNHGISISEQTQNNLPPRIRMSTLYAVSQSMNGRVANTCNLSETLLSWETRWGDAVGDFAPLADLTVEEVKAIGRELDIPRDLVEKTPSDGLCGSSDEEALGFKYSVVDNYIRTGEIKNPDIKRKIDDRVNNYRFKRRPIPYFDSKQKRYID